MSRNDAFYQEEGPRFDQIPAIVFTVPSWNREIRPEEFGKHLQNIVEGVAQTSALSSKVQYRVQYHQIGSAAEWSRTVAIVLEVSAPIVGYLSGLATIAQFALEIIQVFREKEKRESFDQASEDGVVPDFHHPGIGLQVALGIAASHYRGNYGELKRVEAFWHVRTNDRPDAVAFPWGSEIYTITLLQEDERFVYTIRGDGECIEHLMVSGHRVLPLDLPNFLGVESWEHLRCSESGRIASDQLHPFLAESNTLAS